MDKFDTAYNNLEAAIIRQEGPETTLDLLRQLAAAHVAMEGQPVARHIGDAPKS